MLLGKHWSKDDCSTSSNVLVSAKDLSASANAGAAESRMKTLVVNFMLILGSLSMFMFVLILFFMIKITEQLLEM